MGALRTFIHQAVVFLCTAGALLLAIALSPAANAAEHDLSRKFQDNEKNHVERYKFDNSVDEQENIRIIELLKKYAKKYTPIPITEKTIQSIDFSAGARSWYLGYGLQYSISGYEGTISLYVSQMRNDLNNYELWIQEYDANTASTRTSETYDDLVYTLTSAGVSGSLYYLRSEYGLLSLGLELSLLSFSRLNIESYKADKSYVSNGLALLGYPVWRHTSIIPIKVRYRPFSNVSIGFSIHYSLYGIHQETTSAETAGEWLHGCNSELCSETEVFPSLGIQIFF